MAKSTSITLAYLVLFQLSIAVMKTASLIRNSWPDGWVGFLFLSPVPSIRTWKNNETNLSAGVGNSSIALFLGEFVLLAGFYSLSSNFWNLSQIHWTWQSYVCVIPFVLLVDFLGRSCLIAYGLFGKTIVPIHDNFLGADNLSDFWSSWNVWFADWLKEICFQPFLRQPVIGVSISFLVSGLLHEFIVNLPLYWIYDINLLGTMVLYFLVQGYGMFVERQWLPDERWIKRLWTWSVVVIPAPLVLNLGTLRIFHLGFF